nr:reverse transcriptase domain-containing protein [Tanacetum cinerariifolium]
MSSDNAQSAITYTSISSDSDGPSWGIILMNASEFPDMDPYGEVAQQGQAHPLSHAYVPDLMKLDEHVPDPEEDPNEEHEPEDENEDLEEDPNEENEPEDEDTREPSKNSDEIKPFEEDETAVTPPPPRHRGVRIYVRPQTPMTASTQALVDAFAIGSFPFLLPPTSPTYDQAPLGHRTAMIRIRDDIPEEDMPSQRRFAFTAPSSGCDIEESSVATAARAPRSQCDFVDTRSPVHDAWTIARAVDRAEDVGYVRALQASEQRMMTSIEEVNLRTDRRNIRLEIDVVRGQRTTYETELQEDDASQSLGGGLRRPVQPTRVCSYADFMKCQPLNFKGTKGVVGLSQWLKKMESIFHIKGHAVDNQVKFATCTLLGAALTWWNGYVRTLGHDAAYAMT